VRILQIISFAFVILVLIFFFNHPLLLLMVIISHGYIGLRDMDHYDTQKNLLYGDSPSALQSFALGNGVAQRVEYWVRSWPWPTRRTGFRLLNKSGTSAWLNGQECIWKSHGVWGMDESTGEPKVLKSDYFVTHPETGETLSFNKDFYLPFVTKFVDAIHEMNPNALIFVSPVPNEVIYPLVAVILCETD